MPGLFIRVTQRRLLQSWTHAASSGSVLTTTQRFITQLLEYVNVKLYDDQEVGVSAVIWGCSGTSNEQARHTASFFFFHLYPPDTPPHFSLPEVFWQLKIMFNKCFHFLSQMKILYSAVTSKSLRPIKISRLLICYRQASLSGLLNSILFCLYLWVFSCDKSRLTS